MDDRIKMWLFDIIRSINEIESYFDDRPKQFIEYQKDTRTRRAVERNLEIIGEAVNRILKVDPNFLLSNGKQIVGTRNKIIHGYDVISDELIWSIIINNLPKLKQEIEAILS